ncbi:MAG: DUF3962 domain-containing protein [Clostridia bacterium]|nr:DUF3962 domain-containing protein [Clostridia bacterium]
MNNLTKIQLMSFCPKHSMIRIYAVGFPKELKEPLAKLAVAANPKYNYDTYALPLCSAMRILCANWIYDLVEIKSVRKDTDDSKWLVSLEKPNCENIARYLKAAAQSYYGWIEKENVKKALNEFISMVKAELFDPLCSFEEIEIIDEHNHIVSDYAYRGLCLKLMDKLIGKQISVDGINIKLHRCGGTELMSQPLIGSDGDLYSYVLTFNLQTAPPNNYPMLLINPSIRKFKTRSDYGKEMFKNDMSAYVKTGDSLYQRVAIQRSYKDGKIEYYWKEEDKCCYQFNNFTILPDADTVIHSYETYNGQVSLPQILCTHSTENSFGDESNIGTGVSFKEKECIYRGVYALLNDVVDTIEPLSKALSRKKKLHATDEVDEIYKNLKLNTGKECLDIEIYSYEHDIDIAKRIRDVINEMLLPNTNVIDGFRINICLKPLGNYADVMSRADYKNTSAKKFRIQQIENSLSKIEDGHVVGAIILLPDGRDSKYTHDVKDLLRCGFAMNGRLTQFFVPNNQGREDSIGNKIKVTILDLLRQFGYSKVATPFKELPSSTIVAINAKSNLTSLYGKKIRSLPMSLTYDGFNGKIFVESPAICSGLPLPYYKACLELCKLSMNAECEKICNDAKRRYIEQKVKGLENYYRERGCILLVSGEGFFRSEMWPGISNKKISNYEWNSKYQPNYIDIGEKGFTIQFSLNSSNLRVFRLRNNDEIPDYFSALKENNSDNNQSSTSGIYNFGDVLYSVTERPNDAAYWLSYKSSHAVDSSQYFKEKTLVEYYPIRICDSDDPVIIADYLDELRKLSPQYNDRPTNAPLPLHYLNLITEYFEFK